MSRWIVVSNRLPFSFDQNKKKFMQSSGGLVTAIKGIKTVNEIVWIGTADDSLKDVNINNLNKDKGKVNKTSYVPIFLSRQLYNSYYNDFSNDVLRLHFIMRWIGYDILMSIMKTISS